MIALVAKGTGATKPTARERQKLLQQQIVDAILQRKLTAGSPLPPEHELMEELGAGRNSIREAIKALDAVGIVEVQHGFGTFVSNDALTPMVRALTFRGRLSLFDNGREALELVDVRQALETGLIPFVVATISDDELELVRVAAEGIEAASRGGSSIAVWDQQFHAALFAPLGNELLSGLLDVFWQVYNNISVSLDGVAPVAGKDLCELADAHTALFEAVKCRDAVAAVNLMTAHFDGIRGRVEKWARQLESQAAVESQAH
ncbi:FCD domain-containing protein [Rothia sp. ZJ1223]|uniref:FadR/GntR family transcriptional regulator n=1 Tax=Rothia sp. ZJ1223 TaxID=2811098 RepID=UPI00195D9DEE|nr:FadR family transcriptional regulator [Rothia sp. ZJ1223]